MSIGPLHLPTQDPAEQHVPATGAAGEDGMENGHTESDGTHGLLRGDETPYMSPHEPEATGEKSPDGNLDARHEHVSTMPANTGVASGSQPSPHVHVDVGKPSIPDIGKPTHGTPSATPPPVATPARAAPEARLEDSRPNPQTLRISAAAADARLRRSMSPSLKDGSYKVSQEIVKQYRKGGKGKQSLLKLFETCGYCKEPGWWPKMLVFQCLYPFFGGKGFHQLFHYQLMGVRVPFDIITIT